MGLFNDMDTFSETTVIEKRIERLKSKLDEHAKNERRLRVLDRRIINITRIVSKLEAARETCHSQVMKCDSEGYVQRIAELENTLVSVEGARVGFSSCKFVRNIKESLAEQCGKQEERERELEAVHAYMKTPEYRTKVQSTVDAMNNHMVDTIAPKTNKGTDDNEEERLKYIRDLASEPVV